MKGKKLSFFHCGEYGTMCRDCEKSEKFCRCPVFNASPGRPHYHALLFGHDFSDKAQYDKNSRGEILYTSPALEKLWGWGFTTIGALTFESAAYCARYVMKKIGGDKAASHYERIDKSTGEVIYRKPEYITMSLHTPIGKGWFEAFKDDAYPCDFLTIGGRKTRPPKYYDRLLQAEQPVKHYLLKEARRIEGEKHPENNTRARLRVRETVKRAQITTLKRTLDK